jgi:hypothetical protein
MRPPIIDFPYHFLQSNILCVLALCTPINKPHGHMTDLITANGCLLVFIFEALKAPIPRISKLHLESATAREFTAPTNVPPAGLGNS